MWELLMCRIFLLFSTLVRQELPIHFLISALDHRRVPSAGGCSSLGSSYSTLLYRVVLIFWQNHRTTRWDLKESRSGILCLGWCLPSQHRTGRSLQEWIRIFTPLLAWVGTPCRGKVYCCSINSCFSSMNLELETFQSNGPKVKFSEPEGLRFFFFFFLLLQ